MFNVISNDHIDTEVTVTGREVKKLFFTLLVAMVCGTALAYTLNWLFGFELAGALIGILPATLYTTVKDFSKNHGLIE